MPKLGDRYPYTERVPTNVNLPSEIRKLLEKAIDHVNIHTLTDSVVDAILKRAESQKKENESSHEH